MCDWPPLLTAWGGAVPCNQLTAPQVVGFGDYFAYHVTSTKMLMATIMRRQAESYHRVWNCCHRNIGEFESNNSGLQSVSPSKASVRSQRRRESLGSRAEDL